MTDETNNKGTPSSVEDGVPLCSKCSINERAPRGSWCRPCRREYQKAYNDRVRPRPTQKQAPCEVCGTIMTWLSGVGPDRVHCSRLCASKANTALRRQKQFEADPSYRVRQENAEEMRKLRDQGLRRCGECREVLPFESFARKGTGLQHICRSCQTVRYWGRKSEAAKVSFESHLRRHYKMSRKQWTEKLISQQGRCAVCRIPMTEPHVDHDHRCCPGAFSCGKCVRGLLCGDCNVGLGKFQDDADRLRDALAYLEGYAILG